jgi:hypothetical protein
MAEILQRTSFDDKSSTRLPEIQNILKRQRQQDT